MDVFNSRSAQLISNTPKRLYRALPPVVLGTLFNILDAVSTGLLIFPADQGSSPNQFKPIQMQGLSMFIMSTILSQVAMTLGGSHFPGALGAMLIEIVPFLRGVGSDIQNVLGSNNPALVPTVLAAYALTSLLTGLLFVLLGLLKLGNIVAYFPHTVLTGAIGAIGLSLFILGLGLVLPESSQTLTLSVLFSPSHLPLLAASFLPAVFLSLSKRSQFLDKLTRGAVHNAYFIPGCLCSIPVIFWIVVASNHIPKETLITHGWLFRVEISPAQQSGIGTSWNYWREFDFPKVEWWALKHAVTNIVLLVVIGVLNLPIFVPALASTLDVPYDMNHEFLGQGVANLLAGIVGTVPNILQYSYSVFVTRANGGRFELVLITMFTLGLFFTSSLLLPYVPAVLASAMVLFIGLELLLEAVWESTQTLVFFEWCIVLSTLLASTLLGFAEGFGIGIGTAAVVYLVYGIFDSRAQEVQLGEWNEKHNHRHQTFGKILPVSPLNHQSSSVTLTSTTVEASTEDIESAAGLVQNHVDDLLVKINARVVVLSGYVFFASIPSLEANLLDSKRQTFFVIVDLTSVHRLETAAVQCFDRVARDLVPRSTVLILCGVKKGTGVHADFERAGANLVFDSENVAEKGILTFETRGDSLAWCQREYERVVVVSEKEDLSVEGSILKADIYQTFCKLFHFDPASTLHGQEDSYNNLAPWTEHLSNSTDSPASKFIAAGALMISYAPGQTVASSGTDRIIFLVEGQAEVVTVTATPPSTRPSLRRVVATLPKQTLRYLRRKLSSQLRPDINVVMSSHVLDFTNTGHSNAEKSIRVVARSRCVTVEIQHRRATDALMRWAHSKVDKSERMADVGAAVPYN